MKKIILCFGLFISGCVSLPYFQKSVNGSEGYTVQNLKLKNHILISFNVPRDTRADYLSKYAMRAVGEECFARGYRYFDFGEIENRTIQGFCYAGDVRSALAITFNTAALKKTPRKFIVEDLNSKSITQLKINDELLQIEGRNVTSVNQVKVAALEASENKKNTLRLKIKREGRELKVVEPIADFKGGQMGKEDLDMLRRDVQ